MKGSVRFILAIVLLMLSYSIGGNAMNITSCISQNECSCQLSESTSDTNSNSSFKTRSLGYDRSSQSLSISDVELGFKSVTETSSNNIVCVESLNPMISLKTLCISSSC